MPTFQLEAERKTFFIIEIYVQFIEAISLFSADKFRARLADATSEDAKIW